MMRSSSAHAADLLDYDDDDDDDLGFDPDEGEGILYRTIEIKEQDRFLPIANIARIMKRVLPNSAKVGKDSKESIQECVSEFISFITSEASDKCQQEKRKTINGDDILWAMSTLGFDKYVEPLKIYLAKYREAAKNDKPVTAKKSTARRELEASKIKAESTPLMMPSMQQLGTAGPSGAPSGMQIPHSYTLLPSGMTPGGMMGLPNTGGPAAKLVLPSVSSIGGFKPHETPTGALFPPSPYLAGKDLMPLAPTVGQKRSASPTLGDQQHETRGSRRLPVPQPGGAQSALLQSRAPPTTSSVPPPKK